MDDQTNYTFLSLLIPEQLREAVNANSTHNMVAAANALEWHIFEGLCENLPRTPRIINVLPVGSYPQYYSSPFIKESLFSSGGRNDHVNVGFCNIKLMRTYFIAQATYKTLDGHFAQLHEPGVLIVYSASDTLLEPVKKIKKKYPSLKVCVIVADLPNLSNLSTSKSFIHSIYIQYAARKAYSAMSCVECFTLLTKYMADYMHITKPFCVMEGIATDLYNKGEEGQANEQKTIFYSGTLHRCFGILHLLEAFHLIKGNEYRLVICGIGDCEAEIRQAAEQDDRIVFMEQIEREEILKLQQRTTVLVNPRQNNEEFTKYSFPSKIIEYLSSGTPIVAYKLDGIPDEYDPYLFYPKDNSVESLAAVLIDVCNLSIQERTERRKKQMKFVHREKCARVQVKKIIDMISNI